MITRRNFIQHAGAGSLALAPFMQHLGAHAAGDPGGLPKRFVFVVRANGLRPYGIVPKGLEAYADRGFKTEKLIDEPLAQHALNESMLPLEPFKDRLSIIQGLSSKICSGSHGGKFGVLGAYTSADHAPPRKETLDTTLARQFPGIFPQLAFHIGVKPDELFRYLKVSAQGRNTRTPAYVSPMLAYKEIFGTVMTGDRAKIEAEAHQNLMDFLVDDVKRAKQRLSSAEKEKLDHYLHGFEALRDRQVKLNRMGTTLAKHAPGLDDKFSSETETHRLEAHFDTAAASLITGLTNVVTIKADNLEVRYTGLGLGEKTLHGIGHLADDYKLGRDAHFADGTDGVGARKIVRSFQMELLAGLARKLDAVPEGDGTMLDNTVIVFLSDAGDRHHVNFHNMPLLVLGNLAGAFKTGRYLHYPAYNQPGHRTLANLHMSLLHAAGMPSDRYGDRDLGLSASVDQDGPLAELMV